MPCFARCRADLNREDTEQAGEKPTSSRLSFFSRWIHPAAQPQIEAHTALSTGTIARPREVPRPGAFVFAPVQLVIYYSPQHPRSTLFEQPDVI